MTLAWKETLSHSSWECGFLQKSLRHRGAELRDEGSFGTVALPIETVAVAGEISAVAHTYGGSFLVAKLSRKSLGTSVIRWGPSLQSRESNRRD